MRLPILAAALLVLAAPAAEARGSATSRIEHLRHGGLGTQVDPARLRGLPKAYAVAAAARKGTAHRASARQAAERVGYKPVTELTGGAFPNFYPGLGAVYVRPKTLPVGPFLTFDRKGHQISTVYMLSLEEMNAHKKFDATGTRDPRVNHVTVYYHGGHPGVDFPHYHYVLWHVSKKDEARVAK